MTLQERARSIVCFACDKVEVKGGNGHLPRCNQATAAVISYSNERLKSFGRFLVAHSKPLGEHEMPTLTDSDVLTLLAKYMETADEDRI